MSQGFGAIDFYSWLPAPKPCLGIVKLSFEEKNKHKKGHTFIFIMFLSINIIIPFYRLITDYQLAEMLFPV